LERLHLPLEFSQFPKDCIRLLAPRAGAGVVTIVVAGTVGVHAFVGQSTIVAG